MAAGTVGVSGTGVTSAVGAGVSSEVGEGAFVSKTGTGVDTEVGIAAAVAVGNGVVPGPEVGMMVPRKSQAAIKRPIPTMMVTVLMQSISLGSVLTSPPLRPDLRLQPSRRYYNLEPARCGNIGGGSG